MTRLVTLDRIKPYFLNRVLCRVTTACFEMEEGFAVLRVEDNTATKTSFRKFQLDKLKEEILDSISEINIWQPPSKKVDILVKFAAGAVVPHLKQGTIVCLCDVECRTVPYEPGGDEPGGEVYELYVNNEAGNVLHVIPCDDLEYCVSERLDLSLVVDGKAFVGIINVNQIRNGLSFHLFCEVMKVTQEKSTGNVALRVRDATKSKIVMKKFNLNPVSQSEEIIVDGIDSREVDILVTSPPQNFRKLTYKIVKLGTVICERVAHHTVGCRGRSLHMLSIDASLPSFLMKICKEQWRSVEDLRW